MLLAVCAFHCAANHRMLVCFRSSVPVATNLEAMTLTSHPNGLELQGHPPPQMCSRSAAGDAKNQES
jgi:hypothetical protein